jgi:hypothetical protein
MPPVTGPYRVRVVTTVPVVVTKVVSQKTSASRVSVRVTVLRAVVVTGRVAVWVSITVVGTATSDSWSIVTVTA